MSKALCFFIAGVILSISIKENNKELLNISRGSDADLTFLMEIIKLNKNLAIGMLSGFLIGTSFA